MHIPDCTELPSLCELFAHSEKWILSAIYAENVLFAPVLILHQDTVRAPEELENWLRKLKVHEMVDEAAAFNTCYWWFRSPSIISHTVGARW